MPLPLLVIPVIVIVATLATALPGLWHCCTDCCCIEGQTIKEHPGAGKTTKKNL